MAHPALALFRADGASGRLTESAEPEWQPCACDDVILAELTSLEITSRTITTCPDILTRCTRLTRLQVHDCTALQALPQRFCDSLEVLEIRNAPQLTGLPASLGALPMLHTLVLDGVNGSLHVPSPGCLKNVTYGPNCHTRRDWLSNLNTLETLEIRGLSFVQFTLPVSCKKLHVRAACRVENDAVRDIAMRCTIPEDTLLTELEITDAFALHRLPESLQTCQRFVSLTLKNCASLTMLPDSFGHLQWLETLSIDSAELLALPATFGQLKRLTRLDIAFCPITALPESMHGLESLSSLCLLHCTYLCMVPSCTLPQLADMTLDTLPRLQTFPMIAGSLRRLCVLETPTLNLPDWLAKVAMTSVSLRFCSIPPGLQTQTSLLHLNLSYNSLRDPNILATFSNLTSLLISNQPELPELSLASVPNLRQLTLTRLQLLKTISGMAQLHALEEVCIHWCLALVSLPDAIGTLPALKHLKLASLSTPLPVLHNVSRLLSLELHCVAKRVPAAYGCVPDVNVECFYCWHGFNTVALKGAYGRYQRILMLVLAGRRIGRTLPAEIMYIVSEWLIPDGMVGFTCDCLE
jgi:Leucine-rich repeat (LRR) protein